MNLSKKYLELMSGGAASEAEELLINNISNIGYAIGVTHLWRFHSFNAFEDIRQNLVAALIDKQNMPWQAIELVWYLQEYHVSNGGDSEISLGTIFEKLCRTMAIEKSSRGTAIQNGIVWNGYLEPSNQFSLPEFGENAIHELYCHLDQFDLELMEAARLNRCDDSKRVCSLGVDGDIVWNTIFKKEFCIEVYIGPYFFKKLNDTQKAGAKIPNSFSSPFYEGLKLLIHNFLRRGWSVLPLLCWRGGLFPKSQGLGRVSFSYHSHGEIPGRYHYKFGHFSDLMVIDEHGYAGYSKFSNNDLEYFRFLTKDVSEEVMTKIVDDNRKNILMGERPGVCRLSQIKCC